MVSYMIWIWTKMSGCDGACPTLTSGAKSGVA